MKSLKFKIKVNAPKEKVWDSLWQDANYRKWTSAFAEGSHAVSDWNEGSKILFLGNENSGMYSIIEKKILNQEMIFKHMGEVKDGIETTSDWAGSKESYLLSETNGVTELNVELDSTDEFQDYFNETFPKALELVKQISEK